MDSTTKSLTVLFVMAIGIIPKSVVGWSTGRASHYDSIHQGSCMFGGLPSGSGWEAAALSDRHPDFSGSCGSCYELRCKPMTFNDGFGQSLDRNGACKGGWSVVVKITDSCPCDYPNNAYSNRRWCCGDMPHFDLATSAFGQLADPGVGVIGIEYQRISCPGAVVRPYGNNPGNANLPNNGYVSGVSLEVYAHFGGHRKLLAEDDSQGHS